MVLKEGDLLRDKRSLIGSLRRKGVIRSEAVARAMMKVPREEFLYPRDDARAWLDTPIPIGRTSQTISAPHMVAIMLEELNLRESLTVLEVGAGSGYSAALMAELVNPGRVVTIERVPELVGLARSNLNRLGYSQVVEVVEGDGTLGYPKKSLEALYDRISVTASAPRAPMYLKAQLRVGGLMLIPVGGLFYQDLLKIKKMPSGQIEQREVCGCAFVPLIGEDGYGHPSQDF